MKILLVVKSKILETLGPMYLSAIAKQAGHECMIVDIKEAFNAATMCKPDIIGYSVHTGDHKRFMKLNSDLKQMIPFTSIMGAYHATFFPSDFENDPNINMVIKGEAENVWAELLQSPAKYPDLDAIPHPDRTDFPDRPIRDFICSRGCPGACRYCYNPTFTKMYPELARIRMRSPEDVVREVESVAPKFAYFQDSTFGVSMRWLRKFSRLYREKQLAPFHVHLRPNQATEERVNLLADAGCVSMKMALETASDRLRKLINRGNTDTDDVYEAARLLKKRGIAFILQNIVGLPTASIEEDLQTLEVNVRCRPAYAWVSIFQPYPATGLAEICEREGYYTGDYSEIGDNFFDKSVLNFTDEHKEQIEVLQRIFAFCVEMQVMPTVEDLSWKRLPKFIHTTMRKVGDKRMFPGIM